MRRRTLVWIGSALFFAASAGCGGTAKTETTGPGGAGAGGGSGATSSGAAADGGGGSNTFVTTTTSSTSDTTSSTTTSVANPGGATVAFHEILFGDTDAGLNPQPAAWKQYGFNLDGKVSTANSVDLCQPAQGAKPGSVYPDGTGGIDNSFGKSVLPLLTEITPNFSGQANYAMDKGRFTLLFSIHGIDPGKAGTFLSDLVGGSFPGGSTPDWKGSDKWLVRSDSLVNGDPAQPRVVFPMAQVSKDASGQRVWKSNAITDLDLHVRFGAFAMTFPIKLARITMVLSDDDQMVTQGMIGGVLPTEAFIAELGKVAATFDPDLCPGGGGFESLAQEIRQTSDILADGTQDPAKTCDAISIGLGFTAQAALLGNVFDPPAEPAPCK